MQAKEAHNSGLGIGASAKPRGPAIRYQAGNFSTKLTVEADYLSVSRQRPMKTAETYQRGTYHKKTLDNKKGSRVPLSDTRNMESHLIIPWQVCLRTVTGPLRGVRWQRVGKQETKEFNVICETKFRHTKDCEGNEIHVQ